jgi:hypothetical protein
VRNDKKSRSGRLEAERATLRRTLHRDGMAPECLEIKVDLAWSPASALAAAELALQSLERDEEIHRSALRIAGGRNIHKRDGIPELRLIRHAHRCGGVEAGNADEIDGRQRGEGANRVADRGRSVADIGSQTDDRSNPVMHHSPILASMSSVSMRIFHAPAPASPGPTSRRENGGMRTVTVLILLPPRSAPPQTPGGWLERAREVTAARHLASFTRLGATDVRIVRVPHDGRAYGRLLRDLTAGVVEAQPKGGSVGLIVLGGGAMPLAGPAELEPFLTAALAHTAQALANSYYSADAIAISDAGVLLDVPDLPSDNALPRWLRERRGIDVADLREDPRLALDIDSPLDVLLLARDAGCPPPLVELAGAIAAANPAVLRAMDGVAATLADRRAELLVAGRTSAWTLLWLERNTSCRVRALVEERGLRASTALAMGETDADDEGHSQPDGIGSQSDVSLRPPRSVLGLLLDGRGPGALGAVLAELGDAAVIDTRVLLAHRLGTEERAWPSLADRLASDLLRASEIADPWLRALTEAAAGATIPILFGGHTLVGPGLPLIAHRTTPEHP